MFAPRAPAPPAEARGSRTRRRATRPRPDEPGQVRCEPACQALVVGRVAEHEVVGAALLRERPRGVLAQDGRMQAELSRFALITRHASRSDSTNVARAAPRESASSPIAPDPANRSSTLGVVDRPDQVERVLPYAIGGRPCRRALRRAIRRPRCEPAMIRIAEHLLVGLGLSCQGPSSSRSRRGELARLVRSGRDRRAAS